MIRLYHRVIQLSSAEEKMMKEKVLGTKTIKFGDQEIDLSKGFARKSIVDLIKEHTGIDLLTAQNLDEAKSMAKSVGVDADECSCL